MDSYVVNQILISQKITDYLSDKGINPVRKSGNLFTYHCPIHKGDHTPSFIVYEVGTKGRDFQTYYCFGCKSGITILNLISELEGVNIKDAFIRCAKEVNILPEEISTSCIQNIISMDRNSLKEYIDGNYVNEVQNRDLLFLSITLLVKRHIKELEIDRSEIDFFDKNIFPAIENAARKFKMDVLSELSSFLMVKGIPSRRSQYIDNKRQLMYNNPWK